MVWKYNAPGAAPAAAAPQLAAAAPAVAGAHPLPPPVAPAPVAPPAAAAPAPAPAAPGRRRRSASEIAAAAAATQPVAPAPIAPVAAPVAQVQAPVVHTPVAVAQPMQAPSLPPGGFLSLFTPVDSTKTVAAALARIAEEKGGEPNIFPTIEVTGGEQGGLFDFSSMNPEGSNQMLPNGRNPFTAILLSYRLLFLGWPAAAVKGGPKHRPKWSGTIDSNAGEAADIAMRAFKNYQMRSRPAVKGTPEPFLDDRCHPALTVEVLLYEVDAGLMCARSTGTYDSLIYTNASLFAAFPGGAVTPTPVYVGPDTWRSQPTKNQPDGWLEHGIKLTPPSIPVPADITATVQAFQQFYQQAGSDPGLIEALQEWNKYTLPDAALSALRDISTANLR